MGINYNKVERLELLRRKSVIVNSEKSRKLLRYSTMPNGHLDWYISENYLKLFDDFQKRKIQTLEFCISFENIGKLISNIIDILELNLIILSPHEKSLSFSNLFEKVFVILVKYTCKTTNFVMKTLRLDLRIQLKKFILKFKIF